MRKVSGSKVVTTREASELPLPAEIQEALGELVGAAREGLLALSDGLGLGVVHELMEREVEEVVGPKGRHDPELDRTWPDAAASLREGLEDTLTLMRLGIDGQLAKTLSSTNPCESLIEIVRYTQRNVKRWQDGDMRKRWTAAGMLVAEQQFRRIIGYKDLAKLVIAIERHTMLVAEKNRDRQKTRQPVTV